MAKYKCPKCGNKCESKEGCFNHKTKKPLNRSGKPWYQLSDKTKLEATLAVVFFGGEKEEKEVMWNVFRQIWYENPHRSEVSGKRVYGDIRSTYFHHILAKSKYKKFKYYSKNIIILTSEEHEEVENNPSKFEEINKRRELLLEEYNQESE